MQQPSSELKEQRAGLRDTKGRTEPEAHSHILNIHSDILMTPNQVRSTMGLRPMEICEWCKDEVKMMVQKGTGVCSQRCAKMASHILFSDKEKAEKFHGGYSGENNDAGS
jgi:hypothetical protein